MELWITGLLFLLGLLLIVKGGDWFLEGAVWLAEITGLPRFLIGATVVSLVTTLPELIVSVMGVWEGEVDLAVGNAVGSVTANLGLILGLSAAWMPIGVTRTQFDLKAVMMCSAAGILWLLCRHGQLWLVHSLLLLGVFLTSVASAGIDARRTLPQEAGRARGSHSRAGGKVLLLTVGIGGILAGSQLLIRSGGRLALLLGIPPAVVGVTMVAVGTSLPELVTAVTALRRREAALSIGNIIGANIIDLTLILPACALVSGGELPVSRQTAALDLPVCLGLCLLSSVPPLLTGRFFRWQGAGILFCYALYLRGLFL